MKVVKPHTYSCPGQTPKWFQEEGPERKVPERDPAHLCSLNTSTDTNHNESTQAIEYYLIH